MFFHNVPGGLFSCGEDDELLPAQGPVHACWVSPFAIGWLNTTDYRVMVSSTGYVADPRALAAPPALATPQSYVSLDDISAFLEWANANEDGYRYALATSAQIERAIRGGERHRYPWGDEAAPEWITQHIYKQGKQGFEGCPPLQDLPRSRYGLEYIALWAMTADAFREGEYARRAAAKPFAVNPCTPIERSDSLAIRRLGPCSIADPFRLGCAILGTYRIENDRQPNVGTCIVRTRHTPDPDEEELEQAVLSVLVHNYPAIATDAGEVDVEIFTDRRQVTFTFYGRCDECPNHLRTATGLAQKIKDHAHNPVAITAHKGSQARHEARNV